MDRHVHRNVRGVPAILVTAMARAPVEPREAVHVRALVRTQAHNVKLPIPASIRVSATAKPSAGVGGAYPTITTVRVVTATPPHSFPALISLVLPQTVI